MGEDRLIIRPSRGPLIREFKRRKQHGGRDRGILLLVILALPLAWLSLVLILSSR